ncbi:MAG: hypothetical protein AB1445_05290 [Bacillota bacterium]
MNWLWPDEVVAVLLNCPLTSCDNATGIAELLGALTGRRVMLSHM